MRKEKEKERSLQGSVREDKPKANEELSRAEEDYKAISRASAGWGSNSETVTNPVPKQTRLGVPKPLKLPPQGERWSRRVPRDAGWRQAGGRQEEEDM